MSKEEEKVECESLVHCGSETFPVWGQFHMVFRMMFYMV